jgi:hypothetical protein
VRILLHDNQLCERGTTTSLVDYGRALNERGHEVEISYWSESPANVPEIVTRIGSEFRLHPHADRYALPPSVSDFDHGYFIKAGDNDGIYLPQGHSLIHAVFQNYEPHGSRYAYISAWLALAVRRAVESGHGRREGLPERGRAAVEAGCTDALEFEHLDLIVDTPMPQPGFRAHIGVPEDAFVILRFGAPDTFDIPWARQVILDELDRNPSWYFVGLNTDRFTSHERALFLPRVMDPVEKASIIAMANVFVTARGQGEAFGVAIAEALQIGIPVLAWRGGNDQAQVDMLDDLGGLYRGPRDLRRRLRRIARGKDHSSADARRHRGDMFRPDVVTPRLERLLGLSPEGPADGT